MPQWQQMYWQVTPFTLTIMLFFLFPELKLIITKRGPAWPKSDLQSNRIIGENQAFKALELYHARLSANPVQGKVDFVQRYWDITKSVVMDENGDPHQLCYPAMVNKHTKEHRMMSCHSLSFYLGLCFR